MNSNEIILSNLRRLLAERNVTCAQVVRQAVRAGHTFDSATMSRIMRGKRRPLHHVDKLAAGLGVEPAALLEAVQ